MTAGAVWSLPLPTLAATEHLAAVLAPIARARDVIALAGDLGAGKTAFARAFVNARCGETEVPSPTFNLALTYDPPSPNDPVIWHFDLYRLEDPEEALELGIEDAFADGLSLVEWPERLSSLLPRRALRLTFSLAAVGRSALIEAPDEWADRLHNAAAVEGWNKVA